MPALSNNDVVFNTDTTNSPVLIEDSRVDVLARLGVLQVRLDDEAAEVDLRPLLVILHQIQETDIALHQVQQ